MAERSEEIREGKPWVTITIGLPQQIGEIVVGGMGEFDEPLTADGIEETVVEMAQFISKLLAEQGHLPPINHEPGQV